MPLIQIILTVFYVFWLLLLLVLLYLIYRSSERRLKHIQNMELTLFDVAKQDAESARQAVELCKALIVQKDANNGTDH